MEEFPGCHPCGGPSTGDPPTLTGSLGSVSWGHCSFPLGLGTCKILSVPSETESLFPPVLWSSIIKPLTFQVRFPRDSSCPSVGSPGWEVWRGVQNLHHSGRTSGIVLQSVGHPPGRYGIWFYHDCAPNAIAAVSSLSLGVGYLLCGFQHPPVDGCSTVSCDFGALAEKSPMPFYSIILNQKPPITSLLSYLLYILYLAFEAALNITDAENAEPLKTYL